MSNPLPLDRPQTLTPASPLSRETFSKLPGWRFWIPLLMQAALIIAIPAKDAYTYATGTTVILKTVPVDPYDLIRGYSQTLSYEISQPNTLKKLPGGEWFSQNEQGTVYVVLEAPQSVQPVMQPPLSWKPVRVSSTHPADLNANQIALKGKHQGWQILYGLETYYMPENQRQQINDDIRTAQGQQAFVVETKIDRNGDAVPVSLWIRDRNHRF